MPCASCGTSAVNYVNQYRMGGTRRSGHYIRRRGNWGMCFYFKR